VSSIYTISEEQAGQRLDKALAALVEGLSRARIQKLLAGGHVRVNGAAAVSASNKVKTGDEIAVTVPPLQEAVPQAEDIKLDIIYEDEHLLVINKPAGVVVHPGAGNHEGTLVNALLHHCGDSLSGIGGVKRPGIVHRLDKDTTGLMIAAKNDAAHQGLAAQLADRTLSRIYHAVVLKVPVPLAGRIDRALVRHRTNRLKMTVTRSGGKEALTHYKVIQRFGQRASLVECKLESGRTHQIRVHMESIKNPLIGDPLYGPQATALRAVFKQDGIDSDAIDSVLAFPRQALHAHSLAFKHPVTGEAHSYSAPTPPDISNLLKNIE
jgi:23S rRNA pseudouridine1911/1915/1917 synthase